MARKHSSLTSQVVRKTISTTRRDIADWKLARQRAEAAENPKQTLLQDIFNSITDDALLASQISNRIERTISAPFELTDANGNVNDAATQQLMDITSLIDLFKAMLESELFGFSLVEISLNAGNTIAVTSIPRRNIDPVFGRFFPDPFANSFIAYRQASEYGKWLLEFNADNLGTLNKAVPHVLFKRFAQSCWSELCEIYGIPPRYIKTNTQDQAMLDRAESMLREVGSAAAFVIDTTEEFQFAQGVQTNGDVYANLIRLCNNEISLLISGAIIGQDTENGNYSKEQASMGILDRLIESDRRLVETYMNSVVLPALNAIGAISTQQLRFRFASVDDKERLWQLVHDILPYKDIDNKWLEEKFGIPVTDKAFNAASLQAGGHGFFV